MSRDPVAAVKAEIEASLKKLGMGQGELDRRINMKKSTLNEMLNGKSLGKTKETLQRLSDIETVVKLPPGRLVRILAAVGDKGATIEAILHDGSLPGDVKDAMVVLIEHYGRGEEAADAPVTELDVRRRGSPSAVRPAAESGEPPTLAPEVEARLGEHVVGRIGDDEGKGDKTPEA